MEERNGTPQSIKLGTVEESQKSVALSLLMGATVDKNMETILLKHLEQWSSKLCLPNANHFLLFSLMIT